MSNRTRTPNVAKYRTLAARDDTWARMVNSTNFNGPNGCWEWMSTLNESGYGMYMHHEMPPSLAHRLALHVAGRPVPEDMTVDHLCKNRRCVNPAHLEVVTGTVNSMRGNGYYAVNARKTHCPQGHAYQGENIIWGVSKIGNPTRSCRTCKREQYLTRRASALVA